MATSRSIYLPLLSFLFLAITFSFATSARVLNEDPEPGVPANAPGVVGSVSTPGATSSVKTPGAPGALGSVSTFGAPGATGAIPPNVAPGGVGVGVGVDGPDHTLTFFMHDILGGSNPSAKAVTGVVTNPAVNGQVPFAKPNGANLPVTNGVPQDNGNNGIINNNNLPFLTGVGGTTSNVFQNSGNNNGNTFPSINGGQLPQGNALQRLMFGTLTVIDDELTEGQELGSGLIGKAQGFYAASSIDGTSQTMAFTVMLEGGSYIDSFSLMGVHRSMVAESELAVMGGTGKYVNVKGHAVVKTFQGLDQQNNDGLETLLQFIVYLYY